VIDSVLSSKYTPYESQGLVRHVKTPALIQHKSIADYNLKFKKFIEDEAMDITMEKLS
jgi:hypothetical protein